MAQDSDERQPGVIGGHGPKEVQANAKQEDGQDEQAAGRQSEACQLEAAQERGQGILFPDEDAVRRKE